MTTIETGSYLILTICTVYNTQHKNIVCYIPAYITCDELEEPEVSKNSRERALVALYQVMKLTQVCAVSKDGLSVYLHIQDDPPVFWFNQPVF